MVDCLILYHYTITSLTKCFLLRAMFHEETFEIHVSENNTVLIFLWNVPSTTIHRAIFNLEMADITIGRGEGKIKIEAENDAWETLSKRLTRCKKMDSFHIEEKDEMYSTDIAT